jgi:type I restriction-modification system DNA methylase subunit
MSLFQNSVLNKYLKGLESEKVNEAYERFASHFHNPTIQENIRNSKEEQYQGEFLIDLFVNVFGYIKNPTPDFNLTTELKNIKGSKKTDGAILKGEKALAVIELKGTNTTDLSKVETQAFGYKNNQPGCNYVITSNFEKLRFYIDNAVDFEEFNLFQLTKERFEILCLCLSSEYLLKDIPKKIKDESLTQEENITKKLYKDYASFRNEIFDAIQNENPEYDKLTLFKKTQKLLDRFLFIFFAEDRLLLPPNSIRSIVNQWTDLKDKYDEYFTLYDRFKKYFGYMNTGHRGQQHDIFAYNGGLFAPDEILDNIKINDDLLHKHTVNLSNYDFESEVSVNILGHIFEHSLNDIDEIQAEIQGIQTEQNKTKRKKDGVFYTPKYITKYIVDNTVGKLCEEKKTELDIQEAEYEKERKGRQKATLKKLTQKLEDYRNWLLQITICDPACGSGAFLNQALEFLIAEHQYIDELQAKLFGDAMILSEVENAILENNIYGVDINEESVDIAKLSLWLRTAQKGRKLTSLNSNIKSGNSLIDDPNVAGEKAFNWHEEFPKVFAKGGFDVIIGNPPYLNMTRNNTDLIWLDYYINHFESIKTANSKNLYTLFNELSVDLIKDNGISSFIIPEGFLKTRSYEDCVATMQLKGNIYKAIYFEDWVFDDATTGSMIFEFLKTSNLNDSIDEFLMDRNKQISQIVKTENPVLEKYTKLEFKTIDFYCDLFKGMAVKDRKEFISEIKNNQPDKFLLGNCISRYTITNSFYCDYNELTIVGGTKNIDKHNIEPRILIRRTGDYLCCVLLENKALTESTLYSCSLKNNDLDIYFLLGLLNSKLLTYIVRQKMIMNEQAFPQIMMTDIKLLKIPLANSEQQQKVKELTQSISTMHKIFFEHKTRFNNLIIAKTGLNKLSRKLNNWNELEFGVLLKELEKLRKKSAQESEVQYSKLSLSEEAEWMQYFNEQKQKATEIKIEIEKTDKEIDGIVYELYGLTENEINTVEEANA